MQIPTFIKQAQGVITQNAPAILTGVGVVGTVGTAYFTARGTFKAAELLAAQQGLSETPVDTRDKIKLVWTLYLPAAGVASATIVAIIYANRINAKRMAALLTAYTAADKAYNEYQEKVKEHLTGPKEQKIRDEIAQDRTNANTPDGSQIHLTGNGDQLFRDEWTGRYFRSSVQAVKQAENEINASILKHDYASLTELYSQLGLDPVRASDDLGWCVNHMVEIVLTTTQYNDEAIFVVDFRESPFPDYTSAGTVRRL